MFQRLCSLRNYGFVRLDGSMSIKKRAKVGLCKLFAIKTFVGISKSRFQQAFSSVFSVSIFLRTDIAWKKKRIRLAKMPGSLSWGLCRRLTILCRLWTSLTTRPAVSSSSCCRVRRADVGLISSGLTGLQQWIYYFSRLYITFNSFSDKGQPRLSHLVQNIFGV